MSRDDFVNDVKVYPDGIEKAIHSSDVCYPELCLFHAPSDHHMTEWPIIVRTDRLGALCERMCEHGCGHPDPDSLAWVQAMVRVKAEEWGQTKQQAEANADAQGVHGCDGCCWTP